LRTQIAILLVFGVLTGGSAKGQKKEQLSPSLYQGMQWRNIGPFRGGRSVAVTGVIQDTQTFYFGGVGGGVFKSTDGGESWNNVTDGFLKTSSVGAIAVAPSDPNVIYLGMGEHAVRGVATSHGDGVYKSTDAGRTWKHMGLEKTRAISRIRIHPTDPDVVYVAAQGAPYGPTRDRGIYRSSDGGKSWENVLYVNETSGASDLAMDPTNPRILYAAFWDHLRLPWEVRSGGPGSGIHKSTDGGTTWQKLSEGLPRLMGKIGVDVAPNGDRVYAVVEADPGGGLLRSDNGGKTWSLQSEQWTIRGRAWYYMEVFADPQNPDVVWVCNAPLMKSIDGGKTFTNVRVPHGDTHDLWIHPKDPRILINANDGGGVISYNGGLAWSTDQNQPTAQFYRVNTDNRFPYWVYAGQQDNSTVGIKSRTFGPGIGWKDWQDVGGCESAHVAFNPDDPALVYAGCYQGQITEYDHRLDGERSVQAYPELPLALPMREMKYRFNWNAPIVVSSHNRQAIYHAGNVLLKSEDRGRSWVEISPDLTRNDDEKKGLQGTPITNEGAGGEIYATIFYVAESPHQAGVIWAGTDDGLVQLTRDGGKTWQNVTPAGIGEAQVNAIEVSPHDPATAYLAVTKYKFNDFTPHIFKTTDYGKKWERLVEGIAPEAWVRVVREDPVRKGLLYAGTETGAYVSFDGGRQWQSLQLNLPVTPITDLKIQSDDLVAATQGRAFWILDDLSPLRQIDEKAAAADLYLFAPRTTVRAFAFGGFGGSATLGKNPPAGAIIDYYVAKVPETPLAIEILDGAGRLVRRYSSEKKDEPGRPAAGGEDFFGPPPTRPLEVKAGMNRTNWDLRREQLPRVPGVFSFGSLAGRRALPGTYQVKLTVGGKSMTQSFELKKDPRLESTVRDFEAQEELMAAIDKDLTEIHESVIQLRDVRSQLEVLSNRAKDVETEAKALADKANAVEDALIQKRTVDGQTVINFPVRLNHHFIYLRGAVDGAEGAPTEGARKRFADIHAQWMKHKATVDQVLGAELAALNAKSLEKGVPAVVAPAPKR